MFILFYFCLEVLREVPRLYYHRSTGYPTTYHTPTEIVVSETEYGRGGSIATLCAIRTDREGSLCVPFRYDPPN